jgi:hypothetical protein
VRADRRFRSAHPIQSKLEVNRLILAPGARIAKVPSFSLAFDDI